MRPDKAIAGLIFMLALSAGTPSFAQDSPAVQVDMSVLNSMDPSAGGNYQSAVPSAVPARNRRPSLTGFAPPEPSAPEERPVAAYQPPYQRPYAPRPQQPQHVSRPVPEQPAKPVVNAVSFPVQVKERTNQYDPSFDLTPMATEEDEVKQAKKASPPLPAFKPIKTVAYHPEPDASAPAPLNKPSFEDEALDITEKTHTARADVPEITLKKSNIPMPAVPPTAVKTEPLKRKAPTVAFAPDDELAQQLVEPDKMALVRSIESVSSFVNALAPTRPKAPTLKRINALPLPPVPGKKPAHESSFAEIDRAMAAENKVRDISEIAAIEPASGGDASAPIQDISEGIQDISADITADVPADPAKDISEKPVIQATTAQIPRQPPKEDGEEEEYITLPFAPGLSEADSKVTAALDDKIVPLLKKNPDWRLQIQAFAGKADNGLKNARRMSLSRALSIRSHLLEQGIEARRMDVRALGMQTDRNPVDRVDFVFFNPNI